MKHVILLIAGFFLLTTLNNAQIPAAENVDNQIIKVNSGLVTIEFIAPFTPNSKYRVEDNGQSVNDFHLIDPAAETIDWVLYLDINPKDQPMFGLAPLKRRLRKTAQLLSAPTVIVNLQFTTIEKARKFAGIPADWNVIGVKNTEEAWTQAAKHFAGSVVSRKSLFWMSSEQPEMTRQVLNSLPKQLTDKSIFTFITTISPGKAKIYRDENSVGQSNGKNHVRQEIPQQMVGYTNLSLNTQFTAGLNEGLIDYHFDTFIDQCRQLHTIYFSTDNTIGESIIYAGTNGVNWERIQNKKY